jgi:hypothetical protein
LLTVTTTLFPFSTFVNLHFGSEGKLLVDCGEPVLVEDFAAGRLLALELVAVEVGDPSGARLGDRDPGHPHDREHHDGGRNGQPLGPD